MNILGYKIGMNSFVSEKGLLVPVTLIHIPINTVSQNKLLTEQDQYDAIQIRVEGIRKKNFSKAETVRLSKNNIEPGICKEFRLSSSSSYKVGDVLSPLDIFETGQTVNVTGISKGKGFQGVVRRHGFSLQPRSHGNTKSYRTHGSTGQRTRPGRVFPGKKMAGHLGAEQKTVKSLRIMEVRSDLLVVRGSVPGPKYALLKIINSIKG